MKKKLLTIILCLACMPVAIPPDIINAPEKPLEALRHAEDERKCIAATLSSEARGEGFKGLRAVYDSILARMKKKDKTACQIVLEKHQYTGMTRSKIKNVSEEALTDLETIGRMHPVVEGCDYFHSTSIRSPKWVKEMEKCKVVNNHIFYRLKASSKEKMK